MNLARATQLAIQTLVHYVPEDSQEVRLALATFDAVRQAFDKHEVKDFADLRRRLSSKGAGKEPDPELDELF